MACGLRGLQKGRGEKKDRQRRSTGDIRKDIFFVGFQNKVYTLNIWWNIALSYWGLAT